MSTTHQVRRRHPLIAVAAIALTLAACGSDDGASSRGSAEPKSSATTPSPKKETAAPQGDGAGGSGCPLLSDADAAQALGVDKLTMDGQGGNCTWITPDRKKALQVLRADYLRSSKTDGSPKEQAKRYGDTTCSLDEPREIDANGGVGVVCGDQDSNSVVFTSDHAYQVNIGDPLGGTQNAELAKGDALAKLIAKLKLPGS